MASRLRSAAGRAVFESRCCALSRSKSKLKAGASFGFGAALAPHGLPAPVHPVPLLRARENESLQCLVVGTRVRADRFARVVAFDGGERCLEAQHVMAVRLAPARCR